MSLFGILGFIYNLPHLRDLESLRNKLLYYAKRSSFIDKFFLDSKIDQQITVCNFIVPHEFNTCLRSYESHYCTHTQSWREM